MVLVAITPSTRMLEQQLRDGVDLLIGEVGRDLHRQGYVAPVRYGKRLLLSLECREQAVQLVCLLQLPQVLWYWARRC